MKLVLTIVAAVLATVGAITLVNLGIETFSGEKVEKPSSYVYANAIRQAEKLCEKSDGILSIGSARSKEGYRYHLKCFSEEEMTFEHKLVR